MENKKAAKTVRKPRSFNALVMKARKMGATEAKLMSTDQVIFDPRSHLKCRFGCGRWGRYWTCPPHLSLSQEAFDRAFEQYRSALVIRTPEPKSGQKIALALEKEAMLQHGCTFALALALCVQCEECAYPEPCRFPHLARPAMDAFGVDVGRTLETLGFGVEFDLEGKLLPTWYTMILLD
jgi:predicted metal-binding protein